jgi:hypothetical protein
MTVVDLEPAKQTVAPPPSSLATGVWAWSNQTSLPPANKQVRSDTGDWATASHLHFSDLDDSGADRSAVLGALKPGDIIRLEHNTDTSRFAVFSVADAALAVSAGTYHTINVILSDSGGTLPNAGTQIQVVFVSAGIPQAAVGHMIADIVMQPNITTEIVPNLMELICDFLQTVTHLVNYVDMQANVGGVIITDAEEILPPSMGDLVPPPAE